jgi:predicted nucleotidyltransferase
MITNEIREVLQKVCSALNKQGVEYLIVGGVAVGYHGYRRISGITVHRPEVKTDLDFWYKPTTTNFVNLVKALKELNVDAPTLDKIIFNPQKTFLKIPHNTFHTDFLPQMKGLKSFEESKKNATEEYIDGNMIHILSYDDLIQNKISVGRDIDKDDIENLK